MRSRKKTCYSPAIMQPYFLPYAGYFRLFAATDLFVVYECVQFPRRGWVHRNQLVNTAGAERWLTLPLEKVPIAAARPKNSRLARDRVRGRYKITLDNWKQGLRLCVPNR
jgi:hypothetical protein